jgi:hypothetical protein
MTDMNDSREKPAKRRGRPPGKKLDLDTTFPGQTSSPDWAETTENPPFEQDEFKVVSSQPPMRPTMRAEDPREAAARRAAQIRGHIGDLDEGTDEFSAPTAPDGWTYEWKRKTVMGQEDPAYQVALARSGWENVPTSYHPEMMPGQGNHPTIERKGMSLMMRPASISDEIRDIEYRKARNQVRVKEQQLNNAPDGTFERSNKNDGLTKIKKSYESIPVPRD